MVMMNSAMTRRAGVRWRWGAKGLGCDGAAPRKGPGVTVRDGAGWCGTALDGTTGRNRAQGGCNRVQLGAEGGLAALQTL